MFKQGWFTIKIPGGKFLSGFPDIFAWHPKYGLRLIETKLAHRKLRKTQKDFARKAKRYNLGVWVLEHEDHYSRLFKEPNWRDYM